MLYLLYHANTMVFFAAPCSRLPFKCHGINMNHRPRYKGYQSITILYQGRLLVCKCLHWRTKHFIWENSIEYFYNNLYQVKTFSSVSIWVADFEPFMTALDSVRLQWPFMTRSVALSVMFSAVCWKLCIYAHFIWCCCRFAQNFPSGINKVYRFHLSVYVRVLDDVREPSTGRDEQQTNTRCVS